MSEKKNNQQTEACDTSGLERIKLISKKYLENDLKFNSNFVISKSLETTKMNQLFYNKQLCFLK